MAVTKITTTTALIPAVNPAFTRAEVLIPLRFSRVNATAKIIFQPQSGMAGANSCACPAHQITHVCVIWCAGQAHEFAPAIPDWGWKIIFAVAFTLLNLRGIKTSARVNAGLTAGMSAVVVVIFVTAIRYILGHPHAEPGFFTRPFYDPTTFTFDNLFGCTSLAVLTYIGFDAISTLSEEAENPKRNILVATLMPCAAIGYMSAAASYCA